LNSHLFSVSLSKSPTPLKRLLAIALIAILLLNTTGFYVILVSMQYRHDVAVMKALDADRYDATQTVILKLPISVPYVAGKGNFERMDGVIEHEGEHYRLVKQKYADDTLTMVCIRDTGRKNISEGMADYVKSFTDKAAGHHHSDKPAVSFIKDYLPHYTVVKSLTAGWESPILHRSLDRILIPSFEPSVIHPPNLA